MLLNSGYSRANAWFPLAEDRGHFRRAGLEITFTAGRGAYTAAPRLAAEPFDAGYGDINALIEVAARHMLSPFQPVALNSSRPTSIRRISEVPAPIS